MKKDNIISFLSAFFGLFDAHIIEWVIDENKISGNIGWKDETERQSFSWEVELEESSLAKLEQLCIYLWEYNLIDGDKIVIPEGMLVSKLFDIG